MPRLQAQCPVLNRVPVAARRCPPAQVGREQKNALAAVRSVCAKGHLAEIVQAFAIAQIARVSAGDVKNVTVVPASESPSRTTLTVSVPSVTYRPRSSVRLPDVLRMYAANATCPVPFNWSLVNVSNWPFPSGGT